MKLAFYGSSLLSAYWNGAATYYRGILRALADMGYDITFYEPDVLDRQAHRDIDPPDWCRVVVYPATPEAVNAVTGEASEADIVVKASGVGYADDALLRQVVARVRPDALTVFWDVDAPATLAELRAASDHPLRAALDDLDLVLTYGGGDPVVAAYAGLGARHCAPIYNGIDPDTHFPVARDPRFAAELGFLGNRLPDREQRVERFFLDVAARMPDRTFLLGGSGWESKKMSQNVRHVGHVGTRDHNAFNCSPRAVLNISRDSMAEIGFSPATRVFEAAGAGACLITDDWTGIDSFFVPDREILVARDGDDVREILSTLDARKSRRIGEAGLKRVLEEHTYARRAQSAHGEFVRSLQMKEAMPA